MASISSLCTLRMGKASWLAPEVRSNGSIVLEPNEQALVCFQARDVRGDARVPGQKATIAWTLSGARTTIAPSTPGRPAVLVTDRRVAWRRRLSDELFASGHARYDWLKQVDAQVDSEGTGDVGPHTVLIVHAPKEDAPINELLVRIPGADAAFSESLTRWLEALVAKYKVEEFQNLGLGGEVVSKAADVFERAQRAPGNGHSFTATCIGNSFRCQEGGSLGATAAPPEGFPERPASTLGSLAAPPAGVAAHAAQYLSGVAVGDEDLMTIQTAAYLGVMLIDDEEDDQSGLYPQFHNRELAPEDSDGDITPYRFSALNHIWAGDSVRFEAGTMSLTASRIVITVDKLPMTKYWGFGLGAASALFKEMAEERRVRNAMEGNVLGGHIRLDWVDRVASIADSLQFHAFDEVTAPGHPFSLDWSIRLPQGLSEQLAEYLATTIRSRRLAYSDLTEQERSELESPPPPDTYEHKKRKLISYVLPASVPLSKAAARGHV
jgi:hypothetical protein